MNIKKFRVENLHQHNSYEILFEDNKLILVSGNGSGKTTLVNLFYYFLSRQWNKLLDYDFDRIILWIGIEKLIFNKETFIKNSKLDRRISKRLNKESISRLEEVIKNYGLSNLINLDNYQIEILSHEVGISPRYLREYLFDIQQLQFEFGKHDDIKNLEKKLGDILKNTQIIYLPTYRRIEKDLKNIFPHLENNIKDFDYINSRNEKLMGNSFLELVEFGMSDVNKKINNRCNELKNFFYDKLNTDLIGSYLDDILKKSYEIFDTSKIEQIDSEALSYIVNRLEDNVISQEGKRHLVEFVEDLRFKSRYSIEDKINAHFVWKLFQIYDFQQKEEADINLLVQICNKYFGDQKSIEYNKDEFNVKIKLKSKDSQQNFNTILNNIKEWSELKDINTDNKSIDFKDLSSGEKQIVSLFTHLILNKKDYFLIIDEPELSLSVPWQETLLPDILDLRNCKGILSVTHSPFIFQNGLRKYTHSLEEFIS